MTGKGRQARPQRMLVSSRYSPVRQENVALANGFPGEAPVRLCPAHGEWITELRHVFDVAWATAWNDDANRLLAPLLGIAALPVVTMPPPPFQPRDKIPPIARFAGQRPAVWIDDLHPAEARTWSTGRHEPTLLIPVTPAAGLTRQAIDQALTWAKQA